MSARDVVRRMAPLEEPTSRLEARQQATLTAARRELARSGGFVSGGNEVNVDPFQTGGGVFLSPRRITAPNMDGPLVLRRYASGVLGDYGEQARGSEYLGFSLGKIVKNVANTVKKAVVDTGHVTGKVVTSKVGQAVLGTALAVTGVGAPAAAAIFATTKGVGNLIKPGGNLKSAATGAAQGAVEGVVSVAAGKVARAAIGKITSSHKSTGSTATDAAIATAGAVALPIAGKILPEVLLPPISVIPSNPADDFQIPKLGQPAPMFPKSKRVVASDRTPAKVGAAKKVVDAGRAVKGKTDQTAGLIEQLSQKLDAVTQAAAGAKAIGDAAGVDALSQAAQAIQNQIANAQNVAGGAAGDIRQLGGAVEGAATGAVAGAGLSSVSEFISNNKALVYGGGAVLAGLIAYGLTRKSGGGGSSTRYITRHTARRR